MIRHLETARLRLTALQYSHIPYFVGLSCDPDVTRYIGGPRERATLPAVFEAALGSTEPFDCGPFCENKIRR